jgi:hypothetical protein
MMPVMKPRGLAAGAMFCALDGTEEAAVAASAPTETATHAAETVLG